MSSSVTTIQELAEDLETEYVETRERISNIIAHNNDTQGNTELIDIRTTYQGYTSSSAGDAVRLQARQLSNRINSLVASQTTASVDIDTSIHIISVWDNYDASESFSAQSITLYNVDPESIVGIQILYYKVTSDSSDTDNLKGFMMSAPEYEEDKRSSLGTITSVGAGTYGPYSAVRYVEAEVNSSDYLVLTFTDTTVYESNGPFSISDTDMTITDLSTNTLTDNSKIIPYEIRVITNTLHGDITVDKDTEIIDARTGIDGTVYNSLGEAIRTQISNYMASGIIEALNDNY